MKWANIYIKNLYNTFFLPNNFTYLTSNVLQFVKIIHNMRIHGRLWYYSTKNVRQNLYNRVNSNTKHPYTYAYVYTSFIYIACVLILFWKFLLRSSLSSSSKITFSLSVCYIMQTNASVQITTGCKRNLEYIIMPRAVQKFADFV